MVIGLHGRNGDSRHMRQNPDMDLLNDSGGQRYQSIDAKLSIALSNVITQAGDAARHVSIKLRLRDTETQSKRDLGYGERNSRYDLRALQNPWSTRNCIHHGAHSFHEVTLVTPILRCSMRSGWK